MPRLLLEGKSLTELLTQVRAEHGPDVTIVAADKLRTRGIGGFFARESYALTVEVAGDGAVETGPDHSLMPERMAQAQAPGSLLDLAAAIDAAEVAEQGVILATAPMHATTPAAPVQRPALSTTSPEFSAILARLTALDAPKAAPELAPEPAPALDPAAAVGVPADAYTRLREVLSEIAPHLDFNSGVPLVLVIPPVVVAPTATLGPSAAPTHAPVATETPAAAAIPQQGRHRRATAV